MDHVDCLIIGAGVVGLACAKQMAEQGREVIVVESESAIGTGTSSRNSEVIHAGIYYPEGSLKARLCVEGRRRLYDYCRDRGVPHRQCGKLIVATTAAEDVVLDGILAKAERNGVTGEDALKPISGAEAMELEPALACTKALISPSTGIVDSHSLMLAYQGDAEAHGAMLAFDTPVAGGKVHEDGTEIRTGGAAALSVKARTVIIAAGLYSQDVVRSLDGFPATAIPDQYFCKGNYFVLSGKSPFSRLIYPVPAKAGLGVHVTIDMQGRTRFGPDTEWIDRPESPDVYRVDPRRGDGFADAIRRYYPDMDPAALSPGYSGIRPKLNPAGAVGDDFRIDGPDAHGVPGLVCLYGIESPGLTASLAIARHVSEKLGHSGH
ncbi:NAD(P)/FAD-dependent oxidoreductase [Rhodospirillaceae bacterium KN72]|uniref:NAD(P)/FAD-dependent oxidoreductase n=1 Tax=Pacificispira spongiicola TaxID=2729598 RepID=A0A7Y0DYS4_9PROT|nr:NAD(P)/FAD-dependent oxidoreductase [Pacificispira spongiicola]NMM44082.1 NAD(P)/FAD-dependent oxidoreductase [Pacificispira spongiicola]